MALFQDHTIFDGGARLDQIAAARVFNRDRTCASHALDAVAAKAATEKSFAARLSIIRSALVPNAK